MLGNEQLIYVESHGRMIISRRDSHTAVRPGDACQLVPKETKLHLFDEETGRNISLAT